MSSSGPSYVLTLNAGSSSLKFALFDTRNDPFDLVASGDLDRVGQPGAEITFKPAKGQPTSQRVSAKNYSEALNPLLDKFRELTGSARLAGIGHRVVHGGPQYSQPLPATPDILKALKELSPFDAEHLPMEIALVEAAQARFPGVPQVLCFDTGFHRNLPTVARVLPIPRRFEKAGVRRYGFHGLSYEYLLDELRRLNDPAATRGRVVLAHLGSGASLAAVKDGKSIDTSMGFTPTGGLVMSSRSGDLDPGVLAYLADKERLNAAQLQHVLAHESGLLGLSETSADMRDLLAAEATDARAAEAIAVFCYQVKKWIGAFAAALGGLDTLVFAGGIGQHCPSIRARICDGLDFLGLAIDPERNTESASLLSLPRSRVIVRVIPTNEELVIARAVKRVLSQDQAPAGTRA